MNTRMSNQETEMEDRDDNHDSPRSTNPYSVYYQSDKEYSDNPEIHEQLLQSPTLKEFYGYIERREKEEAMHKKWISMINENSNLANEIAEQCGMNVWLTKHRVCYIYEPDSSITNLSGIRYQVAFVYDKLTRRWYISQGHSHLPECIKIEEKRTRNPIGPQTLKMIQTLKEALTLRARRMGYLYNLIDNAKAAYKDVEFDVSLCLRKIRLTLKEKAWPKDMEKIHSRNVLHLAIKINDNFHVTDLSYEYIYHKDVPLQKVKMCTSKLQQKLNVFRDLPIKEGFYMFMNADPLPEMFPSSV